MDVAVFHGFWMTDWEMCVHHIARGIASSAGSQLPLAHRPVGFRWYENLNLALRLGDVLNGPAPSGKNWAHLNSNEFFF